MTEAKIIKRTIAEIEQVAGVEFNDEQFAFMKQYVAMIMQIGAERARDRLINVVSTFHGTHTLTTTFIQLIKNTI